MGDSHRKAFARESISQGRKLEIHMFPVKESAFEGETWQWTVMVGL